MRDIFLNLFPSNLREMCCPETPVTEHESRNVSEELRCSL